MVNTSIGLQDIRKSVNESQDADPITVKMYLDLIDTLVKEVKVTHKKQQQIGFHCRKSIIDNCS